MIVSQACSRDYGGGPHPSGWHYLRGIGVRSLTSDDPLPTCRPCQPEANQRSCLRHINLPGVLAVQGYEPCRQSGSNPQIAEHDQDARQTNGSAFVEPNQDGIARPGFGSSQQRDPCLIPAAAGRRVHRRGLKVHVEANDTRSGTHAIPLDRCRQVMKGPVVERPFCQIRRHADDRDLALLVASTGIGSAALAAPVTGKAITHAPTLPQTSTLYVGERSIQFLGLPSESGGIGVFAPTDLASGPSAVLPAIPSPAGNNGYASVVLVRTTLVGLDGGGQLLRRFNTLTGTSADQTITGPSVSDRSSGSPHLPTGPRSTWLGSKTVRFRSVP